MTIYGILAEHRRGIILRVLHDVHASLNEAILQEALDLFGVPTDHDSMRIALAWLEEHQLVSLREYSGLKIASLTVHGEDWSMRRMNVAGVHRLSH